MEWVWVAVLAGMSVVALVVGKVRERRDGERRRAEMEERGRVLPFDGWWDQTVEADPGEAGDE